MLRETLATGVLLTTWGCRTTIGPKDGAVAQANRIESLESEIAALEVRLAEAEADRDAARSVAGDSERPVPPGLPTPIGIVEASGSAVVPLSQPLVAPLSSQAAETKQLEQKQLEQQQLGPVSGIILILLNFLPPLHKNRLACGVLI